MRIRLLGAVAATAALMIGLVAPASAAAQDPRCQRDSFCIFQLDGPGGWRAYFPQPGTAGKPAHTYRNCDFAHSHTQAGQAIDNAASSMINNTRFYVVLWQYNGCTGKKYVARPYTVDSTFDNNGFNNLASGLEFVDDRT